MKYSVSSYSFSNLHLDELVLPAKAKEMSFDAIEFAEIRNGDRDKTEYARLVRETCDKAGIPIANYAIGADFLGGSGGDLDKEIERLCREVDIAAILGVPTMRHDCTGGYGKNAEQKGFQNVLPRIIEGCRAVTEYAASKGIKTMTENHGRFCQESRRVEQIVNGVAHPNFGLLLDMGNFLCADENPADAFGRLAPFAFMVHAKDFHVRRGNGVKPLGGFFTSRGGNYLRGAIIGHGEVPVLQCMRILRENGFDGYISVEFEGMESADTGIATGIENLRYIAELAK